MVVKQPVHERPLNPVRRLSDEGTARVPRAEVPMMGAALSETGVALLSGAAWGDGREGVCILTGLDRVWCF